MKKLTVAKSSLVAIGCAGVVWVTAGCQTATVDPGAAKAQTGAPEVAKVEPVSIPYDASLPKYVVAVEPFTYNASGTVSGGNSADYAGDAGRGNIGPGISAQMVTALGRCGNVEVIELSALKRESDDTYSTKLEKGEVGPFIIRGTVTEFNETAAKAGEKKEVKVGFIGWILGLVGGVTDNNALTYTGAGVAAANPEYEKSASKRTGMVGLDLRIVNGKNNRMIGAFSSSGSFTSVSATSGLSVFGVGKSSDAFAASALGQATRSAMNDAVQKSADLLKTKVPKVE
jgi:curli biogenesis system outer membrane secretion channel CsgG